MPAEDFDAAPGLEVAVRDVKAMTSWCLDHVNNVLWTGQCPCCDLRTVLSYGARQNLIDSCLSNAGMNCSRFRQY